MPLRFGLQKQPLGLHPHAQGNGWLLALRVRLEEPDPLPQGLTHDANFVPAGF